MGPDAFGPPGGGFAAGGGAGIGGALPPDGHAVPTRAEFGGGAERPGFELGTFELTDDADGVVWAPQPGDGDAFDLASSGQFAAVTRGGYSAPAGGITDPYRTGGHGSGGAPTGAVGGEFGAGSSGPHGSGGVPVFGAGSSGPHGSERESGFGQAARVPTQEAGSRFAAGPADAPMPGQAVSQAVSEPTPVAGSWFATGAVGTPVSVFGQTAGTPTVTAAVGGQFAAGPADGPVPGQAASGAFSAASDPAATGGFAPAFASATAAESASATPTGEAFATGLGGSAVAAVPALFGPTSVVEAVQVLAARPDAVIVAGGTVVMPDITAGRRHPGAIVTLHRCAELRGWSPGPGEVLLHAGLTLTEMQRQELRAQVPAVAQAARTVGAPHIRAAATLGGNLMVGPASADLPVVLAALGAEVLVASVGGVRTVSVFDFYDRDGVPQLTPGELVVGARVPVVRGMQGFMKIGVRGGTSRAILSTTLAVDPARRSATCVVGAMAQAALPSGTGRAGLPTLLRADHADRWLADQVDWDAGAIPDPAVYETFGRLVAESLVYGDGAGTLGGGGDPYRRKAAEICARRLLLRALPPLGWLDQVRELQRRADFQRAKQRVERAEQAKGQDQ
ncbi:FAD binding domain-containing protein [Catenulispora subtropica]|uniref:FAD-binding PCMH-type domain-containing protein n=1 Tax=Catenulispora subtropica TaxID=450798 RepID=A0ABN2QHD6_9ACTN